ncbi:MAG: hypothetical protein U0821_27010 [Chloroflexota bacterium]
MKATIEIPEDLYRRVKAKSAREGRSVRDVTAELFRHWVDEPPSEPAEPPAVSAHDAMKRFCGVVHSGVTDLATNPEHFEGFGSDYPTHR